MRLSRLLPLTRSYHAYSNDGDSYKNEYVLVGPGQHTIRLHATAWNQEIMDAHQQLTGTVIIVGWTVYKEPGFVAPISGMPLLLKPVTNYDNCPDIAGLQDAIKAWAATTPAKVRSQRVNPSLSLPTTSLHFPSSHLQPPLLASHPPQDLIQSISTMEPTILGTQHSHGSRPQPITNEDDAIILTPPQKKAKIPTINPTDLF